MQSPKLSTGIVIEGAGLLSPKLSTGIVVEGAGLLSPKISVGIVLQQSNAGDAVIRAPLTHW